MLKVTCAIIEEAGKILVCQRRPGLVRGGKWEFPGGKLHAEESPEECIIREIAEELSLTIRVERPLQIIEHHYDDLHIQLIPFVCTVIEGILNLTDHSEFRWVSPDEMSCLDFSDADHKVIEFALTGL